MVCCHILYYVQASICASFQIYQELFLAFN